MSLLGIFKKNAAAGISAEERAALGDRLIAAADEGDVATMDQALKEGADINFQDHLFRTALMVAADEDRSAAVAFLLERKADATIVNSFGQTPLHLALRKGADKALCIGLIAAGTPLNARDMHGATPSFYAAQTANAEILEALAAAKADLTIATKKGATPLMQATMLSHNDAVEALLKHACAIDAQDEDGRTALMQAALICNKGLVNKFLTLGANFDLKDKNGETAADVAARLPGREAVLLPLQAAFAARIEPFRTGTERHISPMKKLALLPRAGMAT